MISKQYNVSTCMMFMTIHPYPLIPSPTTPRAPLTHWKAYNYPEVRKITTHQSIFAIRQTVFERIWDKESKK